MIGIPFPILASTSIILLGLMPATSIGAQSSPPDARVLLPGPRLPGQDVVVVVEGRPGSVVGVVLDLLIDSSRPRPAHDRLQVTSPLGAWSPALPPLSWLQTIPPGGRAIVRIPAPPELASLPGLVRARVLGAGPTGGMSQQGLSTRLTGPIVLTSPRVQPGARFGFSIALGNFNNDPYVDIAIGANHELVGGVPDRGAAYVFWGPSFTATSELVPPGLTSDAWFGSALGAADFDNDGFDDILVGAPLADFAGFFIESGAAYIFFGPNLDNPLQLSAPTPEAGARFGGPITVGDFNADGFGDVAITSAIADVTGAPDAGDVTVFFGPSMTTFRRLTSPQPESLAFFGSCLAAAPIDADSTDDLVIGSSSATAGGVADAGQAWIAQGPDFTNIVTLENPAPQTRGRYGRACSAGDVDGDGFADAIVSAYAAQVGPFLDAGEVWVHHGPAFGSVTHLTDPLPRTSAQYGVSLGTADIDADGTSELAVGVEFEDQPGPAPNAGAVYFYSGGALDRPELITEDPPQAGAVFGFWVALLPAEGPIFAAGSVSLVVGAITATVDGFSEAGRVTVFP